MSTVATKPKIQPKPSVPEWFEGREYLLLHNVSWEFYERFLEAIGDRRLRVTYDGENLEIMNVSRRHERTKKLLGRLIETLTYELNIPMSSGGSMTFQRKDLKRGLEPDECYWIANEKKVRVKRDLDFRKDPPPDLAIEVEISRGILDRQAIYERLGVPELWKFDGETLTVLRLRGNGTKKYAPATKSLCFPFLPVQELVRFLTIDENKSETEHMQAFVRWIRKQNFQV